MGNIWSENRYIDLLINALLFLTGVNFLHYGQLILPIICFIIFIDRKLQFRVNSPATFIILCLFAVAFYGFSYQLGFYSVMGFTFPMAYYIGSNMLEPNEEKVKKVIYLLGIAMGFHIILNAIYEYAHHGRYAFFMSSSHYDFWTKDKIANTTTAVNADIVIGCLYYLLFHEKNRIWKYLCLSVFVASMFYLLVIGRRTPIGMIILVMFLSFLYEMMKLKTVTERSRKNFILLITLIVLIVAGIAATYCFDLFGYRDILGQYRIFEKLSQSLISDDRFKLYFASFALMPEYPFGGQHISETLGLPIHDLFIDIYDYAGVVACVIAMVFVFRYLKVIRDLYKSADISGDFKLLNLGIYICAIVQMFFEPVMTGSSLFLIVVIIMNAFNERLMTDEQ